MLEESRIELQQVTGAVDNDHLVLDIKVLNPEDRTLYAYGSPRRIVYDDATRTLAVNLHDHHIDPEHPIAPHLPQPRFVALEGGTVTNVRVTLPRILRRIRSASERTPDEPITEEQRLSEARTVTVEMAHQDTPFYYNPRLEKSRQLREWGNRIATITTPIELDPGSSDASS